MQTQDRKRKAKFFIDDETDCDDSNDGVIRSGSDSIIHFNVLIICPL